jgi:hypothetical protein
VTQLAKKKWIIQSHSGGLSVHLGPDPEEGDKISSHESQLGEPHRWVIKRCTESQDSYMFVRSSVFQSCGSQFISSRIYSPEQIGLFWSLPSAEDGIAVGLLSIFTSLCHGYSSEQAQLARDSGNNSSWWKFRKTETASMVGGEVCAIVFFRDLDNRLYAIRNLIPGLSPLLVPRHTRPL